MFRDRQTKDWRLLTSKKQVIKDLARELERLGRPVDHIAAEIVHELRNCEELSRSQIYSTLTINTKIRLRHKDVRERRTRSQFLEPNLPRNRNRRI